MNKEHMHMMPNGSMMPDSEMKNMMSYGVTSKVNKKKDILKKKFNKLKKK